MEKRERVGCLIMGHFAHSVAASNKTSGHHNAPGWEMRCAISRDVPRRSGLLDLVTNSNLISKGTYQSQKYISLRKEWRRSYSACVERKASIANPAFTRHQRFPTRWTCGTLASGELLEGLKPP